jgi:hypothetical protein
MLRNQHKINVQENIRGKIMRSNRIIAAAAGIILFLAIVLTSVWLLPNKPPKLSLKDVIYKVDNGEIEEISFKRLRVELTDKEGRKFIADLESDQAREMLLGEIIKFNKTNTSTRIKYSQEPTSSGWGWIVLTNTGLFFVMWGLTLAVIVYAVRTLSRNKG